jgi:hypothetical protein
MAAMTTTETEVILRSSDFSSLTQRRYYLNGRLSSLTTKGPLWLNQSSGVIAMHRVLHSLDETFSHWSDHCNGINGMRRSSLGVAVVLCD